MRRAVFASVLAASLLAASPAEAHGLTTRGDVPIPVWLAGWAAGVALVFSFVALAALWPKPRLSDAAWKPISRTLGRVLTSTAVDVGCGAIGVALLVLTIWAGLAGTDDPALSFTPTFIYVGFWVGLVPVSVVFGDVFRLFNPWRAIARATAFVARSLSGELPAPYSYPRWLGRWPAALGLFGFAWLELIAEDGQVPSAIALAATVYSAITLLAMAVFGIDAWIGRGEAFSVYFNLFSRLSPFQIRDRVLGRRRFLSGVAALETLPGTAATLVVMLGSVTFDGAAEGRFWEHRQLDLMNAFTSRGSDLSTALQGAAAIGLVVSIGIVALFYRGGILGSELITGQRRRTLTNGFAHSLVPIAFAYAMAHYLSFLVFNGQVLPSLLSDPLGKGTSDWLGLAGQQIDYSVLSADTTWYLQIAVVITGHVLALMLAHDRALLLGKGKVGEAVRSQGFMLVIMVGFTSLALWLLSQANG